MVLGKINIVKTLGLSKLITYFNISVLVISEQLIKEINSSKLWLVITLPLSLVSVKSRAYQVSMLNTNDAMALN